MDGRQPPEQADIIFGAVGVCIALKTLRFCGPPDGDDDDDDDDNGGGGGDSDGGGH
jgi:hypothetical protein